MKQLANKVAVITGAGSGIGRALAIQLAAEGCQLALSDINDAGLQETRRLIETKSCNGSQSRGQNTHISTQVVDVSDRDQVYRYAAKAMSEHRQIDLLINNAGVVAKNSIEDLQYDDFEWVININMWGVVYGTKAFLPFLKQRPEAHIVNIASINSMLGFPENAPYTMSKCAVQGFTETLIQEYAGTKLRISSVHPGGIQTNIANNARHLEKTETAAFNKIAATSPDQAARAIIKGIKNNKEKIFVGTDAYIMQALKRIFPNASVRLSGYLVKKALNG